MYDVLIIGSGPAGMTAGIYSARREMKSLIIGKNLGGQVMWTSEIENYPGFKSINSYELISRIQEQVSGLGVEVKMEEIKKLEKENNLFTVQTAEKKYQSKAVILATGLFPRRLEIEGEEKFTGRGISYCANCDAPFYKDKTVAVVGGGNSAIDAAEVLSKIAKKVYLIHRRQEFRAFDSLVTEVKKRRNIEFILESEVQEIKGEEKLEKIKVRGGREDGEKEIEIDGMFIEIGRVADTDWIAEWVERDEYKQILVDEKYQTKTPGLFAAGDVTKGEFKQITIACGQATIASLASYQYIQKYF